MLLFEVTTPIGIRIRTTAAYWEKIVTVKHPSMRGHEDDVKDTLLSPSEIRTSRSDENVLLFYRPLGIYYVCVVVRRNNGDGFIVTTYKTDKIKEGVGLWPS